MNAPYRLLKELGDTIARYNEHSTEHSAGCCLICRRLWRDICQALLDESNWLPVPMQKRIEQLQDELNALKMHNVMGASPAQAAPAPEPETPRGETPFWAPPPSADDE